MLVDRNNYFEKLVSYKDKQIIKVVTGVRRCGKSTLLKMFRKYLKEIGVADEFIIEINFDDFKYENLLDAKNLNAYIVEKLIMQKMNYILLDEIQNVSGFEKVINSLFLQENVDIYITGSNSYMLSGELATFLTGRYIQIEMMPFSLSEYMKAMGFERAEDAYLDYIQNTSFPFAINLDDENQKREYIMSIYSTVVLKDVISKKKIADPMMLESVLRFVADNIGNILNVKKISDTLTSNGRKINVKTVESYISAFVESYLLYKVNRFDIKGKEHLKTLEKYYIVDIGLRNLMLGKLENKDIGHILENFVYLELRRKGYEVFIGKYDRYEVDFVIKKNSDIKYIQVALSVRNEEVFEREIRPLKLIRDNYPKFILTLDNDPVTDDEGIKVMNALEFVLKG